MNTNRSEEKMIELKDADIEMISGGTDMKDTALPVSGNSVSKKDEPSVSDTTARGGFISNARNLFRV